MIASCTRGAVQARGMRLGRPHGGPACSIAARAAAAEAKPATKKAAKQYADAEIGEELVTEYGEVGKAPPSGRLAGIVIHPTSLGGKYGVGDLGDDCDALVDWLSSAGMKAWQVLPLVPPDEDYFSPYSGLDALCGNPMLISLERLVEAGLLDKSDLPNKTIPNKGLADFAAAKELKTPVLKKAAQALVSGSKFESLRSDMKAFREQNAWVEESALFDCLRRTPGLDMSAWWDWPEEIRDREPATIEKLRKENAEGIEIFVATQFLFDMQWKAVKAYANSKGIEIIGDMPIYVGGHSADVWANRNLFELSETGAPEEVSGVPPDAFSETGQLWGSPLYRWPAHHAEGYKWWAQRIGRAGQVYDQTRIDHFRAFAGYWSVEAGAETAMNGVWKKGPGKPLFDAVYEQLGDAAPFVMAEDLGVITQDVKDLRVAIDAPGMVVLQFAFGGGPDNTHLPHNHYANSFCYPGTHDNETSVGWYKDSATNEEKAYLQRYLKSKGDDIAWDFIHEAMRSVSRTSMFMMQDVLRLDNTHRMNSPGKAEGNWAWRLPSSFKWSSLFSEASELRKMAIEYDRFQAPPEAPAWDAMLEGAEDPLEKFCETAPDADECRVYED